MSSIKQLLQGVEVEWKPLGEVAELKRGRVISKQYLANNAGEYPVYSSQTTNNGEIGRINTFDFNQEAITWTTDGANAGTVFHRDGKFSITNVCGLINISDITLLNYKYLFYWLSIEAKKYVYSGMGNPKLMSNQMEKVPIPIPPLYVQEKIIEILDKFTELTAELQAELQARKSQYDYYREQLLSYPMEESDPPSLRSSESASPIQNNDLSSQPQSESDLHTNNSVWQPQGKVEWKALGEIGEFQRGKRFVKNDIQTEGIPCIHYGEMYTHYGTWADTSKSFLNKELVETKKLRVANKGDVVFVAAGETVEDLGVGTAWLGNENVVIHDACFSYKSPLNPKYVAYFSRTKQFHDQIRRHIFSGKISAIHARGFEKAIIPIPSPEEQERVVNILDKFETLATSISEGLPKEIELRQKQYEYYRDKLLAFDSIKNENE